MIFDNTLSPSFCEKHHVLLLSNSIEQVEIAVTSKTEEQSKLFLRSFFSDKQVHFRIIEEKDFSLRLSRLFSREETKTSNIPNEDELLLEKESVNIERIAANARL